MHNLIFLTDLTGSDLDPYMRLNEAQLFHALEPNPGLFIAESPKVIERALRAGYRPASLLIEEKELERDLADLDYEMAINQTRGLEQTPIYVVNSKLLRQLAGGGYNLLRGALAAMHRVERPSLNNFLATMPSGHPRIAILESVVNPTNIGAIFRSAAALGIDAVLLTPTSCDPLNRRAIRVSMGSVFLVPWGWTDTPSRLKDYGFKTVAMALRDDSRLLSDPELLSEPRLAIVMGTEGDGLAQAEIDGADYVVRIPMRHNVDSLNVAAASAVAFYALC